MAMVPYITKIQIVMPVIFLIQLAQVIYIIINNVILNNFSQLFRQLFILFIYYYLSYCGTMICIKIC